MSGISPWILNYSTCSFTPGFESRQTIENLLHLHHKILQLLIFLAIKGWKIWVKVFNLKKIILLKSFWSLENTWLRRNLTPYSFSVHSHSKKSRDMHSYSASVWLDYSILCPKSTNCILLLMSSKAFEVSDTGDNIQHDRFQ